MRLFEKTYDPLTGLTTTIGSQDGRMVVKTEGDIGPSLDYTAALRNDPAYSKAGIKKGLWHCIHIPPVAIAKMMTEDGFDVVTAHPKEIRKFLTKNRAKYAYLFVTEGKL
ncbi:MAG: hypothetical protein ND866_04220 [Pyrinomonadaceae bacterium]|nr:hypothetical protein [Pyrinomonadaceae bacterium]